MADLHEVYRAATPEQAHIVKNFLVEAGIPAFVAEATSAGVIPISWDTSARVMVSAEHAPYARALIAAVERTEDEPLYADEYGDMQEVDPEMTVPTESLEPTEEEGR
ncbi:MAG: hypothetical protein KatS3mg113_0528 [Planctomycetaceae bacterium]|nr:MAG: hypothetical protein KatS3mg113_0528 [Planctomycetaceae bacterium]